ncbi:MAG: 23S rRNA (guanosine(2251)-2'-O)-methyltransferase RlmB [Oscillospiraceae bacterium]|jgi:23S rRNA (guanosine2251-2'-O)-methyltransferase|nr:23S rRNA (guanosine(2251)-2'-O)-methyltransferase RlmB [Oscillospiraceae bacterium]
MKKNNLNNGITRSNSVSDAETDGIIEGRNPVLEACRAGRKIDKLFVQKEQDRLLGYIVAAARENGAAIVEVDRKKLDIMSVTRAHQGVIAHIPAREYADFDEVVNEAVSSYAEDKGRPPLFVVCDGITDSNNLGGIIRTAEAAGAKAVVVQKRRSAGLTAVVSKVSAGALEHMKVARVSNLTAALKKLKENGFWIFGAAGEGESPLYSVNFNVPCVIVIGSEGEGISRLVLENCDYRVSIPMLGKVGSLNASAAAAVVLYEAVRQRLQPF